MGDAASQVFPAHGSGIGIGYDPLGRRTSMGDGSGQSSWTYGYDQVGRSAAITTTGPSPLSFQYAYDARSLLIAATSGGLGGANGTVSYTHDSLGRVGGSGGGTPAYSPAGDLTQLDGASRARDVARQLCWTAPGLSQNGCANPPTGATVFTHDANGNRTLQQRPNGNRTRYLYDQAHRLTTARNEPPPRAAGALPALPDSPWLVLPAAGLLAAGWYVTRNSRRRMVLRTATGVTIAVL
ncbi:MAG: hypothetical protein FJW94_14550, partial [Actinobacteria bacterium]|nr:hypothetical protein [Actinomycetota bacterium]